MHNAPSNPAPVSATHRHLPRAGLLLLMLTGLSGCGFAHYATSQNEPPSGRYNPISHETNSGNR